MMRKTNLFLCIMLASILFTSCATSPPAPTQTAPPTSIPATPTLFRPANTLLAADKLAENKVKDKVFYTLPGMDQVTVANIPYNWQPLQMDIYYPPGFNFGSPVPAVIFINGFPNTRNRLKSGHYISWGQLAAASGLIGINYQTSDWALGDTRGLIKFILANAHSLGVDKDQLCLWSASSNVQVALDLIVDKEGDYQDSLSCSVVYYGFDETKEVNIPPSNLPLLVVKAGQDDPATNAGIDKLVSKSKAAGLPIELIEYKEGVHAFDIFQDTDETRAIVSRTLEFMKEKLTVP